MTPSPPRPAGSPEPCGRPGHEEAALTVGAFAGALWYGIAGWWGVAGLAVVLMAKGILAHRRASET